MKKTLVKLALTLAAGFALAACQTAPAAPERAPVVQKSTTDLMLEVRKAELELERIDMMARLKFAVESGSEFVKGYVMGQAGGGKAAPAGGGSTAQTILQAQAQAQAQQDNVALRREEMAYANSWDRRALPYVNLGLTAWQFGKNLGFQKWSIGETNTQTRYTLDTLRGAQTDGFSLGSGATLGGVSAGQSATLGGVSAGQAAASAGAAAVAGAQSAAPATAPAAE